MSETALVRLAPGYAPPDAWLFEPQLDTYDWELLGYVLEQREVIARLSWR